MTYPQKKADRRVLLKQAAAFLVAANSGMAMSADEQESAVVYAMDYPYQFDLAEVIATDNLSISDDDKKLLYQTNAERLFALSV